MPVSDEVIVKLSASVDDYNRKLDGAVAKFGGVAKALEGHSARVTKSLSFAGLAGGIGGLVGGFVAGFATAIPQAIGHAISSGLEYASSLQEVAQQLGVTSTELQEYRYAASQVGISNETMDKSLSILTRSFGQVEAGAKRPTTALKQLGFSSQQMADLVHGSAGDAIPKLAEALSKIENPAKRARLEMALFGRGGMALDTLLSGGSAAVNQLRDAAHKLGIVLSEKEIADADKTADKLSELKQVLSANIGRAVASNAASIYNLVDALVALASQIPQTIAKWRMFNDQVLSDFNDQIANIPGTTKAQAKPYQEAAARARGNPLSYGKASLPGSSVTFDLAPASPVAGPARPKRNSTFGGDDFDIAQKATKAKNAQQGKNDAAEEAKRQAEVIRQFTDEMDRANADYITAQAELSSVVSDQTNAKLNEIDTQLRIDTRAAQADEGYTAAQKATSIATLQRKAGIDRKIVLDKAGEAASADALKYTHDEVQLEIDQARSSLGLATTRKERAKLEQKLIGLAYIQERHDLDGIVATKKAGDAERDIAQARLAILDQLEAEAKEGAKRQNLSPGEQYTREVNDNFANMNDQIESLAVDKVKELNEALADTAVKGLGLHGILGDLVKRLIAMAIEAAILKPLMNALFPGAGGAAGGGGTSASGLIGSLVGLFGGAKGKRAGGGNVYGSGAYLVGERGPELFSPGLDGRIIPNHALGGGGAAAPVVRVMVGANDYFDAKVQSISGAVSIETVKQAAPMLIEASTSRTISAMQRPRM